MIKPEEVKKAFDFAKNAKKIIIIAHQSPDGDAIGSTTALAQFLALEGKFSYLISPNDFPDYLKWIPYSDHFIVAENENQKSFDLIESADLLFLLDFNTPSRAGILESRIRNSKATKILIDHHQQPDTFDFVFSDVSKPATCEILYEMIKIYRPENKISIELATSIYVGLITDTGNFKYRNTSARTLSIASDLVSCGLKLDQLHDQLFDSNSESRLRLLSECLNGMNLLPEFKTVYFSLSREQLAKHGYKKGDTEGFVNYGLSLKNYEFSAFFIEDIKENFIKISFRSLGDIDVNRFARKYFNGGGHINAAGGKSYLSLEETIAKFNKDLIDFRASYE